MSNSRQIPIILYTMTDAAMAAIAWILFYFLRIWLLKEHVFPDQALSLHERLWLNAIFIPIGWLILYAMIGTYHSLYKKSRLSEFTTTFVCSLIGCVVLFLLFISDDAKDSYSYYFYAFFYLVGIHFILTFLGRLIFLNMAKKQLLDGRVRFNTLMIGNVD